MITPELFAFDDVEEPPKNSKLEFNSLDECLDAHSLAEYIHSQGNSAKRQKVGLDPKRDLRPMAFVHLNTRLGKAKPITIRALLDSGASESLVLEKHTDKLRVKELNTKGTVWSTPA